MPCFLCAHRRGHQNTETVLWNGSDQGNPASNRHRRIYAEFLKGNPKYLQIILQVERQQQLFKNTQEAMVVCYERQTRPTTTQGSISTSISLISKVVAQDAGIDLLLWMDSASLLFIHRFVLSWINTTHGTRIRGGGQYSSVRLLGPAQFCTRSTYYVAYEALATTGILYIVVQSSRDYAYQPLQFQTRSQV